MGSKAEIGENLRRYLNEADRKGVVCAEKKTDENEKPVAKNKNGNHALAPGEMGRKNRKSEGMEEPTARKKKGSSHWRRKRRKDTEDSSSWKNQRE